MVKCTIDVLREPKAPHNHQNCYDLIRGSLILWLLCVFHQFPFVKVLAFFARNVVKVTLTELSDIKETAKAVNYSLMKLISDSDASEEQGDGSPLLDLTSVVEVLSKQLLHSSVPTKVSVLGWIGYLHLKVPSKVRNVPSNLLCHSRRVVPTYK